MLKKRIESWYFLAMQFQMSSFVYLIIALLLTVQIYAIGPTSGPTIGPELVFVNNNTLNSFVKRMLKNQNDKSFLNPKIPTLEGEGSEALRLATAILKKCEECEYNEFIGKWGLPTYHIKFPNSFWIDISVDPAVLELQTPPLNFETYTKLEPFIQEYVYDVADQIDLKPPIDNTDGHTNIGVFSAFSNVRDFAVFILDLVSHPELALGVLGIDTLNAAPLALLKKDQVDNFYNIINLVKKNKIYSIGLFSYMLKSEVYYESYINKENGNRSSGPHSQAISVKRIGYFDVSPNIDAPVELRFTAARENFKLVLLNYELFLNRINFLKKNSSLDGYKVINDLCLSMTDQEKLSRFYIFVSEMGLDFNRFRPLIFSKEILESELDGFVSGHPNYSNSSGINEIIRYIDDLESSEWIRSQMTKILIDPLIPESIYNNIMSLIEVKISHYPKFKWFEKKPESFVNLVKLKENVLKYKKKIKSEQPTNKINTFLQVCKRALAK